MLKMAREKCVVLENKKVAPGHFVLTCASRAIAKNACPGQFVQILCEESTDPLLPRPFSFLTAAQNRFSILYQVVGKGTASLAQKKKGDLLWALGPLGNGFTLFDRTTSARASAANRTWSGSSVIMVGGGVGIPPLYHLVQTLKGRMKNRVQTDKIHVFLGARNKSLLLCEREFKKLGARLHLATDDGSKGKRGFVTELLEDFLHRQTEDSVMGPIFTCGPTPMLKAVSVISQKYEVSCEISVEVPMACGFGACIGCAIKVKSGAGHRFAIACKEGPVFQAKDILWE